MKRKKITAYLGLGTNIGKRLDNLRRALKKISKISGLDIARFSSVYQSKALGPAQRDFYNMVIAVKTDLSPNDLMRKCQEIELDLGRVKNEKWGPRIIDIDIILFNHLVIAEPDLTVPHKQVLTRRFVLEPLYEVSDEDLSIEGVNIKKALERVKKQKLKKVVGAEEVWSSNN